MKTLVFILLVILSLSVQKSFCQNVSINADGSLPDTSAMLDVSSTSKGFLLPRMTTGQQNSIILPAKGLTIFNTTLNSVMINTGTALSPVWSGVAAGVIDTSNIANFSVKVRSLVSATAPIIYSNGLISITQAGTSTNGYLSSTDWNTFNTKGSGSVTNVTATAPLSITGTSSVTPNVVADTSKSAGKLATFSDVALKQNLVTLTTTGSSGAATFNQGTGTLNIPTYGAGTGTVTSVAKGYGMVADGTITTTGTVTVDSAALHLKFLGLKDSTIYYPYASNPKGYLTANQNVTVTATGDATGTSTSSPTAPSLPLTLATVNSNVGSFTNANITVNGKGLITAASNGNSGTVTSVATGYGLSGGTITSTGTLLLDSATLFTSALRRKDSTSYTTVYQNGLKQNQLNGTGFVKATGTTISYDNSTYLTSIDTTNIANFSSKVRSLFSSTAPITYSNGLIGITQASTSTNGYLSSTDWNTFNNKAGAFSTGNLTETGSGVLTITGGTGSVIGTGTTVQVKQANTSTNGFLSSTDWNTFNNKLSTIDTTNIANFSSKVRSLFSSTAPVTYSNGLIGITQASTSTNGYLSSTDWNIFNNKLSTIDTTNIANFSSKVRSLFSSTAPITYSNGLIGVTQASTSTNGYLSSTDWNTFNNKAGAFSTGNLTETGSGVLTITGGTGSVIGTGTTVQVKQANTSTNGFLSSTDWNTFNNKLSTIDTTNIANFSSKVRSLFSSTAPITYSNGLIGITQATTSTNGYLSSTDWNTFNNKLSTIDTTNIANFSSKVRSLFSSTAPITYSNGLIGITQASTSTNGYLSSTDWNTFNNKQPAGSYLTANQTITLSGDVTGSGTTAITTNVGKINGTSLASLSTGILKNTTGTGVPSIAIPTDFPTLNQNTTGSAATLTTGRTIAITGDLAYTSPAFNGSANVTAAGTLATVNANVGSFTNANITVNAKGLITAASNGNSGTVTSVATGYGLSGGTITSSGTLLLDSATLFTTALRRKDSTLYTTVYQNSLKQNQLNGTGFVKATGTTISYDNSTYLTGNQTISFAPTGDVTGSTTGTTIIAPALVIGTNKVLNTMLAQMPTLTIKGNNTGATANASDLTVAQVNAILPVFTATLNGLVPFSGGSAGKVLHGDGSWRDTASAANSWSITGNSGTSYPVNFLGTTDNKSLRFKTNSIQGMILDSLQNVAIAASPSFSTTNPEKLLVDAGTGSFNVISGKGNLNNFLQLNIKNSNSGSSASSDVVATNDAGTEANGINYVDMGVNSSGYSSSGILGGANNAYLYATGNDFIIGNSTASMPLRFFTTNASATSAEAMRIDPNGNVGIGTTTPATVLNVVKSNSGGGLLTMQNTSASGYSSADFLNSSGTLSGTFGYANASTGGIFGGRAYFNSYANDFLWTANSSTAAIFVKGSNSNVGIGTTTPATALHVYGTNPLTLTGVQLGTTTTSDSLLTINSGTVQKLPLSTFITAANTWSTTGNTGTTSTTNFIGTTDNKSFKIKTNNTQGILLDSLGNVAIGSAPAFDATNPEKFIVNAGTTSSVNAIVGKGNINNYLQLNIQNQSAGTSASSDVVATANNGNETSNYIDMGINGGSNTSGVMGVKNDAYLYNLGQNLFLGTGTAGKSLIFVTGGTDSATNEQMRIDGSGHIGINNPAPSEVLDVTGNVKFSGALMPNNLAGNPGDFLTSGGSGVAPTWFNATSVINTVAWGLTGNSGTASATDFIGTTDNKSFKIKTNNSQGFLLDSLGDVGIGTAPSFTANPNREKLLVDAGTSANPTTSYNVINGKGYIDNYLQLNIQNRAGTASASSDVVASNDAATEAINYVDLGVNSSGNTSTGVLGGVNTGYLYSTGADFAIGNATSGKSLLFFTGGTASGNEQMRITSGGNVGIGTTTPNSTFQGTGSFSLGISTQTANYTATNSDHTILCNNTAAMTVTLPTAVGITGRIYVIKKISTTSSPTHDVTIDGSGSETIDGALTKVLTAQWSQVTIQSNNVDWFIIGN